MGARLEIEMEAFGDASFSRMKVNGFLQALIYAALKADHRGFAKRVHDTGLNPDSRTSFSHFCYSQLMSDRYDYIPAKNDTLRVRHRQTVRWQVSSPSDEMIEHVVGGWFRSHLSEGRPVCLGPGKFICRDVRALEDPVFEERMIYRPINAPIVYIIPRSKRLLPHRKFASIDDPRLSEFLKTNSIHRYLDYLTYEAPPFSLPKDELERCVTLMIHPNRPRKEDDLLRANNSVIYTYRQGRSYPLIGIKCGVEIQAPVPFQRFLYYSGMGVNVSYGAGMLQPVPQHSTMESKV